MEVERVGVAMPEADGIGRYAWCGALHIYNELLRAGLWAQGYPPTPHRYPGEIEIRRSLLNLTKRLLKGAYAKRMYERMLGGNWLRIMQRVWG